MIVKIKSEDELVKVAQEGIHNNLRYWTKLWNAHHGKDLRSRRQFWEEKADLFLEKLQVPEHKHSGDIKIEIDATENTKKKD
jgi:hypothetical protein